MNDIVSSLITKGKYFLLLAVTATLPFSTNLNSFLIILLVALTVFEVLWSKGNSSGNFQLLVPIMTLFILYLYGVAVSQNKLQEFKGLEQKLSLLALPGVLYYSPPISRKRLFYLLLTFATSCFLVSALTFREGYDFLFAEHRVWALDDLLLMGRPFLGMYCAASMLIVSYLFLNSSSVFLKGILLLLFFFFLIFVFILNAKMAALAFSISVFCITNLFLLKKKKYLLVFLINFVFIAAAITVYTSSGGVQKFVHTLVNFEHFSYTEYSSMMVDSFNVRFGIWKCCREVLLSNWVWLSGAGIFESRDLLQQCYIDNSFQYQAEYKFDSHNQYLGIWMSAGILGLLIFSAILIYIMWRAYSRQQYLFLSIIMLFAICCVTEVMLNSQKGILFFTLFCSLFTFQAKEKTGKKSYMYSTNSSQ